MVTRSGNSGSGPPDGHRVTSSFEAVIDRDADEVFAFLLRVDQTPRWRDHLTSVQWRDEATTDVGSLIDVVTTLAWYRRIPMVCEVVELDAAARRFTYDVVEGPARMRNGYLVEELEDGRARFTMQGGAVLDTWYLRIVGPFLKRLLTRTTAREVDRLRVMLEAHEE